MKLADMRHDEIDFYFVDKHDDVTIMSLASQLHMFDFIHRYVVHDTAVCINTAVPHDALSVLFLCVNLSLDHQRKQQVELSCLKRMK